ncbi:class I SAM-dependent methyltransferase [Hwangdonia seohaensis]|uniref:Class I SAM-dependent methyltransferase n=1 Tax=Hwangdonia seohaensis TaxID=1240727 RepID=A0ABW3RDS4_9FLAO|nr:methyltransferase domain-containing protein [Hwangdonia seohaensis]
MNNIKSPLFLNGKNAELIETFDSETIISKYKALNIEVARFFKTPNISLYKCQKTGYRFYYPFEIVGDARFYEDLSKNKSNYYSERWEHKRALNYIEKHDLVLEIGSGFGAFLNMLKASNIQSVGLELNPYAAEVCAKNGLTVKNELIENEAKTNKGVYNVVCSFQVLEHITNVHSFIKASIDALKINGKLIIGVPNNNPYLFVNDKYHTLNLPPHHAGLWDKKALKALETVFSIQLERMEFEPLNVNYSYFIHFQITNNKSKTLRFLLRAFNKMSPGLLKFILCKFIKGRNVLAVFKKI